MGKYDEAIEMMRGRQFAIVEGVNLNVADHWTNAYLLRGRQNLAAKRYKEALADFKKATEIPSNIPSGPGFGDRAGGPDIAYWTGVAADAAGDHQRAMESWNRGTTARATPGMFGAEGIDPLSRTAETYYQALCLQRIGRTDEAKEVFEELVSSGEKAVQERASTGSTPSGPPRTRLATAHYVTGLGYLGLNDTGKAKQELTEALRLSPDLVDAKSILGDM
jgi:tetratricopeptide (TPR) repeat protein